MPGSIHSFTPEKKSRKIVYSVKLNDYRSGSATSITRQSPSFINLLFQVIGTIIAILTIGVSVYFGYQSESSKSILIEFIAERPLLDIDENKDSLVSIFYEKKEIQKPWLFSGLVKNIGDIPIKDEDFQKPLEIKFENARPIAVEITEKIPDDIEISYSINLDSIIFYQDLLNEKEYYIFDVLLEDAPISTSASARIIGGQYEIVSNSKLIGKKAHLAIFDMPILIIYIIYALASVLVAWLTIFGFIKFYNFFNGLSRMYHFFLPSDFYEELLESEDIKNWENFYDRNRIIKEIAYKVWQKAPVGIDYYVRYRIEYMDYVDHDLEALYREIESIISESKTFANFDREDLYIASASVFSGFLGIIIIGGNWKNILLP